MSKIEIFDCYNLSDTDAAGKKIAAQLIWPACVFLRGGLGAGKTTLCKSIIQSFGYDGAVTSPTYNLIQEYEVKQGIIYHMDLYRLDDPAELEYLAIADLWQPTSLFLIEWPDNGEGYLPDATHLVELEARKDNHKHLEISCIR